MSQNRPDNDTPNTTTGGTGYTGTTGSTGYTDLGTTRDTSTGIARTGTGTTGGAAAGAATAPATGIGAQAREYGQKVADAATQAKDYLSDKASVVGDKIQDLRNKDYGQIAEEAKEYARQKPGQALLISAAAGFVIGLLIRGSRR
jgi:ElaB/YqjD/DUF883 family membrane-anchored ribosome-binding protein